MSSLAIRPRRKHFDWSGTKLEWVPGEAQTTHTINTLHLLLPAGERWFVDVFKAALPHVTDRRLSSEIRGFMGQEIIHGRAHSTVLDVLADRGVETEQFTRWINFLFQRVMIDQPLGRKLSPQREKTWLLHRIAVISAIEHFTAVLGRWVLEADGLDRAGADPTMLELLRWHAAEEVEHRSVAFDLFEHLGGTWGTRCRAMAAVAPIFTLIWISGTRFLMQRDGGKHAEWSEFFRAGRRGTLPALRDIFRDVPAYFLPGYHPGYDPMPERAAELLAALDA